VKSNHLPRFAPFDMRTPIDVVDHSDLMPAGCDASLTYNSLAAQKLV
jgi:hypothetical protein